MKQRVARVFAVGALIVLMVKPTHAAECLGVSLLDRFDLGSDSLVLHGVGARLATMLEETKAVHSGRRFV